MNNIIDWCNQNVGFIEAIVAIISSILSFIAIIISIHAARLPFKKEIKLSQSYDFEYISDDATLNVKSNLIGMTINASNVGFRNVNLVYLGLALKDKKRPWKYKKLFLLKNTDCHKCFIEPTQIATVHYDIMTILGHFDMVPKSHRLYIFAMDSEGKKYHKFIGKSAPIGKYISSTK